MILPLFYRNSRYVNGMDNILGSMDHRFQKSAIVGISWDAGTFDMNVRILHRIVGSLWDASWNHHSHDFDWNENFETF